jgi:hypothetical protein
VVAVGVEGVAVHGPTHRKQKGRERSALE